MIQIGEMIITICLACICILTSGLQLAGVFSDWWGISISGFDSFHHGLIQICNTTRGYKCEIFNWSEFVEPEYSANILAVMACSFTCAFNAVFACLFALATFWRIYTKKSLKHFAAVMFLSRILSTALGITVFFLVKSYASTEPYSGHYKMGWSYTVFWIGAFLEVALIVVCLICLCVGSFLIGFCCREESTTTTTKVKVNNNVTVVTN